MLPGINQTFPAATEEEVPQSWTSKHLTWRELTAQVEEKKKRTTDAKTEISAAMGTNHHHEKQFKIWIQWENKWLGITAQYQLIFIVIIFYLNVVLSCISPKVLPFYLYEFEKLYVCINFFPCESYVQFLLYFYIYLHEFIPRIAYESDGLSRLILP